MKIIKYKRIGNGKYELELDSGEKIKLFEDIILKENLLWKKEIDDCESLLKKNKQYEIYDVSIKRLAHHVESKKGMYNYLFKKGYEDKIINETLSKLIQSGYINDDYYAKCYVLDRINLSNDGPLKIKKHFEDVDIPFNLYQNYLDIDENIWINRIKKYLDKNIKSNKKSLSLFKTKMLINLLNLGYEKEMINECLNNVSLSNQEELKEKEREKIRLKLSKKYTGYELEKKIKEKLYQKGFFE